MAPRLNDSLHDLINRADLDGLVRIIDDYCETRSWQDLRALRNACKAAAANGRQVWPASTLAEYRLALLAPAEIAVQVVDEDAGRFTLGPLTEVIAQHHEWAELSGFLEPSPITTFIAYECAIRGQHVDGELFPALESPCRLLECESAYALAEYHDNEAKFPTPKLPAMGPVVDIAEPSTALVSDAEVEQAIHLLAQGWISQSNGQLNIACVDGSVFDALTHLEARHVRLAMLSTDDALAWLTWTGANSGAHGRRRGNAQGRDAAWWTIAALTQKTIHWPLGKSEYVTAADSLQWFRWDKNESTTGWNVQLCVHHAERNRSWAFMLTDMA